MSPARGEVWFADLNPTKGHEQAGLRPVLVISEDAFNDSGAEQCVVLPITSRARPYPTRVEVQPPEGGLKKPSYVICEQLRTISLECVRRKSGAVRPDTMTAVGDVVRMLLGL